MTNKTRVARIEKHAGTVRVKNPYTDCSDGELLAMADAVAADAKQRPEAYSNDAGVALLEQIAKLNRGHAPQGV